jgi:glutathione S-transferase
MGATSRPINPKGFLPALELDDGTILTENLAILVYIAHLAGALLPENDLDRWRALEATLFMTTELHTNFRPFSAMMRQRPNRVFLYRLS